MAEHDDLPSLHSLRRKIDEAKGETPEAKAAKASDPGMSGSAGWRALSDLVAGIVVGGFLGYHADEWLHTRPMLMVSGVLLGMAGGVMNIYRASMRESKRAEAQPDQGDHVGE